MPSLTIPINELSSFDLPSVCLITGEERNVAFSKVNFVWYPRWVLLLLPFACFPALIVGAILTKRAKGELPFSDLGWSQSKKANTVNAVSMLWIVVSVLGAILLLLSQRAVAGYLALASTFVVPVVLFFLFQLNRTVTVTRITDTAVTLWLPSAKAASAVRMHLHSGRGQRVVPMAPMIR